MINIAIDGPAGAGKSSIAKKVAKDIGFIYVDTGALYRSIAYYKIRENILTNENLINSFKNINLEIKFENHSQKVFLNGEDISDKIRNSEVSIEASNVAAIPEVRKFLFDFQKKIAKENNVIMDGRDIGTSVLPNADLKIFLTASVEERAKRRWLEMKEKGNTIELEKIKEDIEKRDYQDAHRAVSPLKQAEDAVYLDTSSMSFEEVAKKIKSMIEQIEK